MNFRPRGVSVIDLVVVIAMAGVLIGLLLPALQKVREAARTDMCSDNLRVLASALLQYHDQFETFPSGHMIGPLTSAQWDREPPPGGLVKGTATPAAGAFWSWNYRIAPFFGFQDFFSLIDPVDDYPWWSTFPPGHPNEGMALISQQNKLFNCPADPRHPVQNYVNPANVGLQAAVSAYLGVNGRNQFAEQTANGQDGILYVNSSVSIDDITDGISNTVMLGERPPASNSNWGWGWAGAGGSPSGVWFGTCDVTLGVHEWASYPTNSNPIADYFRPGEIPDPPARHRYHFWSFHPDGANWAFADGSVRFLTYDVDSPVNETTEPDTPPTVLAQFATRANNDANPSDLWSSGF